MIRILIVDNYSLARNSLAFFLVKHDIQIVDSVSDGRGGLEKFREHAGQVDIVLSEVKLPDMSGLTFARKILDIEAQQKIAFISSVDSVSAIINAINMGIKGYFSRHIDPNLLLAFLNEIMKNHFCISPDLADLVIPFLKDLDLHQATSNGRLGTGKKKFSNRELEVLDMLCQGFSSKVIAERLYISESTVKNHLHSIYAKFGVNCRAQAVAIASKAEEYVLRRI